jgi:diguanylate cyclase (GGDEF)-like protein
MDMQALIAKLRPKRLRTRLLVPVVVLVAAGSVGISLIEDFATRRQIEQLTEQKGSIVLQGVLQRLQDRKKAKALFVELLAEQLDLATLIENNDRRQLTQLLLPLKVKLGIDFVKVLDPQKRNLLVLSDSGSNSPPSLIDDSLTGLTKISTFVSKEGLAVVASSPVKGANGIAGVVVIGSLLTAEDLESHKGNDAIDLALFENGNLVNITSVQPEVLGLLRQSKFTLSQLENINRTLSKYNFHAVVQELDNGGLLLALIPTQDLISAANQSKIIQLGGLLGLLAAILLVGMLLARDIAKPLESIVETTQDIIRGNYTKPVTSSSIQELQDLGQAINYLAKQLQVQISKLTYQAFHDPLTNLPNRPLFEDRLQRALARTQRSQNTIAVLFLDLDGFKLINDSFGHKAGDRLLVMVSERLDSCLRDEDTLARLGGDEFTILLENIQNMEDATSVAQRIAKQLELPFSLEEHEIFISASIGSTDNRDRPEDFLRDADAAMYAAKKHGKANHQVFSLNMASQARQQLLMEAELRRAIERQEFRVYYQPVIHLDTGQIVEVEALVRWQHPLRGLVPPLEFIPLAEETGLIIPLGQWILEQACKQLRAWHLQYPSDTPLVVGVNLSTKQFQQSQLEDKIATILQEQNLEPGNLKLEITESVILKDTDANLSALQKLKNLGVKLAIDDFGTGFSALNYLKRFPIDTIKIDRSFVNGIGSNPEDTAIVHAIIAFAKALNLGITAEGIETADQLAMLRELNCDRGQGYYFSKPLPSEEIDRLLASSKTIDSRSLA